MSNYTILEMRSAGVWIYLSFLCRLSEVIVGSNIYTPVYWGHNTPFKLHDDNYVLKAMKFCERPQADDGTQNLTVDGGKGCSMSSMYQPRIPLPSMLNTPVRPPT
ncbi:unnamed protein product [Prunus armeniaca]|uniref:Uncharacterized protein n=1 Tax=Prunus armeniaca TaxID=36596 RepID=A0A6J5XYK3_PRUAR|nr:unnamed protein product [Prunus armeniaca]